MSQAELAARAGVSRQLVTALESGRNLPRVDAALALAAALAVQPDELFAPTGTPVEVLTGEPPDEGALVRTGRVGERVVTASARVGRSGWDVADAQVVAGELRPFGHLRPGVVMAGCEPGLELLERLLRESGLGALTVGCSNAAALTALADGRVHLAAVHAPARSFPPVPAGLAVVRYHLCAWQVGLAGPTRSSGGWFNRALSGTGTVVQREAGAGVQATFLQAAARAPRGPRVGGHLEACWMAISRNLPAVTIEPAARALGAAFHALDTHAVELWVNRAWLGDPAVAAALQEVSSQRFQQYLAHVGGYDLTASGRTASHN